jgi:hypothetical protein
VLGSCHDNGYVSPLNAIAPDEPVRNRITLLKSFKTGRQFDNLPFKSITFQSLFRDQAFSIPVQLVSTESSSSQSRARSGAEMSPVSYAARLSYPDTSSDQQSGSKSGDVFGTISFGQIFVNARMQRVDATLSKIPKGAQTSFDRKKAAWKARGKSGPCNQHLLLNNCSFGVETCGFFHEPLSNSEMLIQKTILRGQACKLGSNCRKPDCFYGHQCVCTSAICGFRTELGDMHDIDMTGIHVLTCG